MTPAAGPVTATGAPDFSATESLDSAETAETTGPIAEGRALIRAIDSIRLRHPPINPAWIGALQQCLGLSARGRVDAATVQRLATWQQTNNLASGRRLGTLTSATLSRLRADHPVLSETPIDAPNIDPGGDGENALVDRAQNLERPVHQEAYDELQASENPVAGLPATWTDFLGQMTEMSFLGHSVAGHPLFLQRLGVAQSYLRGRFAGQDDREITRTPGLGIYASRRSQLRADSGTSYHNFGFAVDINARANPWVTGMEGMEGRGRRGVHRNAQATANLASVHAIWRANWLTGRGQPVHPGAIVQRTQTETTDQIWAHFNESDQALEQYLGLRGNAEGVQALLANIQNAPPSLPAELAVDPAEIERLRGLDAAGWADQIERDMQATHGAGTNWTGASRANETGFMSHDLELVRAIRDAAGLSWGACDMHGSSGDFMHFDGRTIPGISRLKTHIKSALRGR